MTPWYLEPVLRYRLSDPLTRQDNAEALRSVDVPLPGRTFTVGHRHPLTVLRERIEAIFARQGYEDDVRAAFDQAARFHTNARAVIGASDARTNAISRRSRRMRESVRPSIGPGLPCLSAAGNCPGKSE